MLSTYKCLQRWIDLANKIAANVNKYDDISCIQLAMISQAVMKTMDYLLIHESNASNIRVSKMLFTLHDTAWKCWTSFLAQSRITTGTTSITLTSSVLQALTIFNNWDSALDQNPSSFNPPKLLASILEEVQA